MKYEHVVQAVFGRPWMVREETFDTIADLVRFRAEVGHLPDDEIRARVEAATAAAGPRRGARTMGSVGVIPIYGVIMPRASLMTAMSGGTAVSDIRAAFREALADESIGSILFDIDSPGGIVDGVEELATEIRDARGAKPIVAIANYTMASAAYYLGAQADEIVASPSSQVGWIGTIRKHTEFSKRDEMEGVKTTVFRDPPGKGGANEFEPISDQARAEYEQSVRDYSAQFHSAVSKGRGVPLATVKADFGQGGGMIAARAKAVGLVDRVETFDATVRRLASGRGPVSRGTTSVGGQLYQVSPPSTWGEPIMTATLVHDDGTEELVEADADGMFTLEVDGEGEPLPPLEPAEGGDAEPADDPGADASGEAGTPPDAGEGPAPTEDDAVALELAQAKHRHHTR